MMFAGKIMKSDDVRAGLISLIDKKKSTFQGGISEIVRKEFDLVVQARENGASWTEIVDTLGFQGKEDGFALAFWRERRRREKKGSLKPQTENGKQENESAGKRTVQIIPASEGKNNSGNQFERSKLY